MIDFALVSGECRTPGGGVYNHCYNFLGAAAQLEQFAGILTGITFAAIAILAGSGLQRRDRSGAAASEGEANAFLSFVTAFIAFATATYLYVSASSDGRPQAREAFVSYCASLTLITGLLQLLIGIARLTDELDYAETRTFVRAVFRFGAVPLIYVYMALTSVDSSALNASEHAAWHSALGGEAIILGTILLGVALASHFGTWGSSDNRRDGSLALATARMSVLAVVIYGLVAAYWEEQDYRHAVPAWGYELSLVVVFVLTASHCIVSTQPAARPIHD